MKPFLFAHAYKNTEPTLYSCPTFRTVNNTTSDTHTHTQLCITDTQTKPLLFQTWLILVLLVSNLSLLGIRGFCHTLFIILSQNVIQLSFFWIFSLTYRLRSFSFACYAPLFLRYAMFCDDNQVKFDNTVGVKCFQPVWTDINSYLV